MLFPSVPATGKWSLACCFSLFFLFVPCGDFPFSWSLYEYEVRKTRDLQHLFFLLLYGHLFLGGNFYAVDSVLGLGSVWFIVIKFSSYGRLYHKNHIWRRNAVVIILVTFQSGLWAASISLVNELGNTSMKSTHQVLFDCRAHHQDFSSSILARAGCAWMFPIIHPRKSSSKSIMLVGSFLISANDKWFDLL